MTLAAVCTELRGEDAIELQTRDAAPLGPAAVRIAVRATSVDFPDVLVTRGLYEPGSSRRSYPAPNAPA